MVFVGKFLTLSLGETKDLHQTNVLVQSLAKRIENIANLQTYLNELSLLAIFDEKLFIWLI